MDRIKKFVEQDGYGKKTGRVAYVTDESAIPEPPGALRWHPVCTFNAAEELERDTGLKEVFQAAMEHGCTVVTPVCA